MSKDYKEYRAIPCACGHKGCSAWHVWPLADVQGVRFTKNQAENVAEMLNDMDDEPEAECRP